MPALASWALRLIIPKIIEMVFKWIQEQIEESPKTISVKNAVNKLTKAETDDEKQNALNDLNRIWNS